MISKFACLLLVLPLIAAEPAGYKYWSAAQLKSLDKPLPDKQGGGVSLESLGNFGRDRAVMVHREASGRAELHQTDADTIVVIAGTATLVVGGAIEGAKTTAKDEVRGASIEGGTRQKIGPGDVMHVAPKTPHQLLLDTGAKITYFTLKVRE